MYDNFQEAAESVLDQSHGDVELVIVVDGTNSVHERIVEEYGDRDDVVIHCNEANVGLLESRNTGAELASGDVVAFIDDDAVADEAWAAELVDSYEEHDALAAGGKMTPKWVAGRPNFLPEEFYWLVGVTHRGFADGAGEVRNTYGSNISFRSDVFQDLGGFNPEIGGRKGEKNLQGGETELCARMRKEYGEGVWYNPDAEVAHKVFDYRTELSWLADRAFWQGYSKRAMETMLPESTGSEETDFARRLFTEFAPARLYSFLTSPSKRSLLQFVALFVLTGLVGAGYLYGMTRYGGTTVQITTETDQPTYRVLWLRPSRGDNISVRRQRIAEELATHGVEVDIRDVTGTDVVAAVRQAIVGDYDAIFGNVRMGLYVGYPLARLLRTPFVGTVSDPISDIDDLPWPLFEVLRRYEWFVLAHADGCSFTYQATYEAAQRRGIQGRKLPNAVNYEQFANPDTEAFEHAREILESDGVDLKKPVAIYIGGLTESTYKISNIVAAAERRPDWEFVFVGEGEEREFVKDAARDHANVHYPGAFEYDLMPGFLAHADVGFCFKDAEQPLKVMEYGAAGVATIAQPGELQTRLTNDEAVFIDPEPSIIAETLSDLADDPEECERLAQNLQARAEDISWSAVGVEFYAMLDEVVKP